MIMNKSIKEYVVEFFKYTKIYHEGNWYEQQCEKVVINTHSDNVFDAYDVAVANGHNPNNEIKFNLV